MKEAEIEQLTTNADNDAAPNEEKRHIGHIIKLHPDGYGFISSREIPYTKIFFHWTSLDHKVNFLDLKFRMKVSFVAQKIPDKGFRAIKIHVETNNT